MENAKQKSARSEQLALCHSCQILNEIPLGFDKVSCRRCNATVEFRLHESVQRSWAYLIASVIAFFPANLLPIMTVSSFGSGTPSTILSGILQLIKFDMWPVAIVVFIASFMVPLGKILGLGILLIRVKRQTRLQPGRGTVLYRMVHFLGKWSMLDVFVVAIMGAVVNLGFITSIEPGSGAAAFAVMVLLTMFAAHAFDPRLIWDLKHNE